MFLKMIKIITVGKIKEQYYTEAANEYLKRLSRYAKVEIVEVDDVKIKDNASLKEEENVKDEFYDYEDLFYKEYEISESTDFNSLINMINMFYDEQLDMLLDRYNKYNNKSRKY